MPAKIKQEYTGGPVNYSLNDKDEELILSFSNGEAILKEVKELIGTYRIFRKIRETSPTRLETINHIERLNRKMLNLTENFDLLPQSSQAHIEMLWYERYKGLFFNHIQAIKQEIRQVISIFNAHLGYLDQIHSKLGEHPKTLERNLLTDFALLLENSGGFKKLKSARIAADILKRNNVDYLPNGEDKDYRRIVRNTLRKRG